MKRKLFGFVVFVILKDIFCANILGVITSPSYSHQVVFWPLWQDLSLRGHQVTVITTDPINNQTLQNLTEINVHSAYKYFDFNVFELYEQPLLTTLIKVSDIITNMMEHILMNDEVQELINDKTKRFDVVMIEAFHNAAIAFASRFNCPLILLTSLDGGAYAYRELENPSHPVLHPDANVPYCKCVSFDQRLASVLSIVVIKFLQTFYLLPAQQKVIEKCFGKDYPLIEDIFKNYSMFFVNSNIFLHPVRPLLPNIIQIGGGLHVRKRSRLSPNLKEELDNAKNGAIFFSLGTNVKSQHLFEHTRREILDAFNELNYKVFWKFEDDNFPNVPENVIISKWFPQQDILQHPNTKLFITQGGLQSLEEAIANQVPIIGIPIMGDQFANIDHVVFHGFGLSLDYKNIEKESFKSAILRVIQHPKYRRRVKEIGAVLQDQLETGLTRAVWWTEYVIRHKGALHFRNPALDLPWYQHYLLDIFGFLLFTGVTFVCVIIAIWKSISKMIA